MPAAATNSRSGSLRIAHPVLLCGGLAVLVHSLVLTATTGDQTISGVEVILAAGVILAGATCGFVLLYRACRCVDAGIARFELREKSLDPGTAVALCAIPYVNLVGFFLVLGPLPERLNRVARAAGARPDAPRELGYAIAVLALFALIPFAGTVFAIVVGMMFPILIFRCSKVVEAIEAAIQPTATPVPSPVS